MYVHHTPLTVVVSLPMEDVHVSRLIEITNQLRPIPPRGLVSSLQVRLPPVCPVQPAIEHGQTVHVSVNTQDREVNEDVTIAGGGGERGEASFKNRTCTCKLIFLVCLECAVLLRLVVC